MILPVSLIQYDPLKQKVVTPIVQDNSYLVGYEGNNFMGIGMVYAPYIPLYLTPEESKIKEKYGVEFMLKQRSNL